jgi:hypothetical protein
MNVKSLQGYLLTALGLLVLVLWVLVLVTNIGNEWRIHLIYESVVFHRITILLASGAAGVVVWYTVVKLLPAAVRSLRTGRREDRAHDAQKRLKELEKDKEKGQA